MRKTMSCLPLFLYGLSLFLFCTPVAAQSFVYDVAILDQPSVSALSEKKLLETYVEVLIELEASTTFSRVAGFNKADYEKYKNLIRYRVRLLQEIKARNLVVPDIGMCD